MAERYPCRRCGVDTEHKHLHDTAHGIVGTHMGGSERFECCACGLTTHAYDDDATRFNFVLDRTEPPK